MVHRGDAHRRRRVDLDGGADQYLRPESVKLNAPPLSFPHRPTWDTPASMQGSGMTGELMVQSLPWGRVFVDGRDTGQETPIRSLRLSAGRHTLNSMTADCSLSELPIDVAPSELGDAPQRIAPQLPFLTDTSGIADAAEWACHIR